MTEEIRRINRIREGWFAVEGTPTDCVIMAVRFIMQDAGLVHSTTGSVAPSVMKSVW